MALGALVLFLVTMISEVLPSSPAHNVTIAAVLMYFHCFHLSDHAVTPRDHDNGHGHDHGHDRSVVGSAKKKPRSDRKAVKFQKIEDEEAGAESSKTPELHTDDTEARARACGCRLWLLCGSRARARLRLLLRLRTL